MYSADELTTAAQGLRKLAAGLPYGLEPDWPELLPMWCMMRLTRCAHELALCASSIDEECWPQLVDPAVSDLVALACDELLEDSVLAFAVLEVVGAFVGDEEPF